MSGVASLIALALAGPGVAADHPADRFPPFIDLGVLAEPCYVDGTHCGVRCVQFAARRTAPRECDRYPSTTPRIIPLR